MKKILISAVLMFVMITLLVLVNHKFNFGESTSGKSPKTQIDLNMEMEQRDGGQGKAGSKYPRSILEQLENTENFAPGTIEHIFDGDINRKGKAVGYHFEGIEDSRGSIINGTKSETNANGVYEAKVCVDGIEKESNGGKSSFFPEELSPQDVIDAINEAYEKRTQDPDTKQLYYGTSSKGLLIQMYIDDYGRITTAFPLM